jgi:uncharacterized protein YciI
MFIIDLTYIVPLEKLDESKNDHMKFIRKYYSMNLFLASGRKVPRTGGIILCLAKSHEEVAKIMNEDPFIKRKIAEYAVTEFMTSQHHPDLKSLLKRTSG